MELGSFTIPKLAANVPALWDGNLDSNQTIGQQKNQRKTILSNHVMVPQETSEFQ